MRIVGRQILDSFCRKHADARTWIQNWLVDVGSASWRSPAELKSWYATVSFLAGNVVIFNVKGNAYRLEAMVAYQIGVVSVIWIGTHSAYDARNRKRGFGR